jgi:hypothetical protein
MPRFRVPVVLSITARDATQAYAKVAHSSITSLEIPGLLRITVHEAAPRPTCRRLRKRMIVRATRRTVLNLLTRNAKTGRRFPPYDLPATVSDRVRGGLPRLY